MMPSVAISIESPNWRKIPHVSKTTRTAIKRSLEVTRFSLPKKSELSVLLCSDVRIRELNKAWRKIDRATNVLSFPIGDSALRPLLGDIAISFETLEEESRSEEKFFIDHFSHMVVHGFLHLLGFDHEASLEARTMEQLERDILARMGIADPYGEKAGQGRSKP